MKLQIYVFPAIGNSLAFHPRFLKPQTKAEHFALFTAFVMRKWRYQLSDVFAASWHSFGQYCYAKNSPLRKVYDFGNRLTTRRAQDEYFLKMIPDRVREVKLLMQIEFIFPASVTESNVKEQLTRFLSESPAYRRRLLFWALVLPTNLYIAKFFLLIANALFSYNAFRVNASWRAATGASVVQRVSNANAITWTASSQLASDIKQACQKASEANPHYHWTLNSDIHDDAILELQQSLKLPELIRTYRRTRMENIVFGLRKANPVSAKVEV